MLVSGGLQSRMVAQVFVVNHGHWEAVSEQKGRQTYLLMHSGLQLLESEGLAQSCSGSLLNVSEIFLPCEDPKGLLGVLWFSP